MIFSVFDTQTRQAAYGFFCESPWASILSGTLRTSLLLNMHCNPLKLAWSRKHKKDFNEIQKLGPLSRNVQKDVLEASNFRKIFISHLTKMSNKVRSKQSEICVIQNKSDDVLES